MSVITPELLAALRRFDTPTICNALEVVAPERRLSGFTRTPLVCIRPELGAMIGFAATATMRAEVAPTGGPDARRAAREAYYEHVGRTGKPVIVVIQDLDPVPGLGAFWGEVNSTVHQALGAHGVVTNGSVRDIDLFAPGFQALAGSIAPSHAFANVTSFGDVVDIHGMTVRQGDLVHADRHGAVVIPRAIAPALPAAIDLIARREKVILDACREPGFTIDRLKAALRSSDEIH